MVSGLLPYINSAIFQPETTGQAYFYLCHQGIIQCQVPLPTRAAICVRPKGRPPVRACWPKPCGFSPNAGTRASAPALWLKRQKATWLLSPSTSAVSAACMKPRWKRWPGAQRKLSCRLRGTCARASKNLRAGALTCSPCYDRKCGTFWPGFCRKNALPAFSLS